MLANRRGPIFEASSCGGERGGGALYAGVSVRPTPPLPTLGSEPSVERQTGKYTTRRKSSQSVVGQCRCPLLTMLARCGAADFPLSSPRHSGAKQGNQNEEQHQIKDEEHPQESHRIPKGCVPRITAMSRPEVLEKEPIVPRRVIPEQAGGADRLIRRRMMQAQVAKQPDQGRKPHHGQRKQDTKKRDKNCVRHRYVQHAACNAQSPVTTLWAFLRRRTPKSSQITTASGAAIRRAHRRATDSSSPCRRSCRSQAPRRGRPAMRSGWWS